MPTIDITDDIAEVSAWWAAGGATRDRFYRFFRLAGSPHDQTVPAGVHNPYWEIIRHLPSTNDRWDGITPYGYADGLGLRREHLTRRFSWAIPSPGDIAWMVNHLAGRGMVEVGAGAGYWAWQLAQAGVDVAAYEPAEMDVNDFTEDREYYLSQRVNHEAAAMHPDRALLLCWPSYSANWAELALKAYQGDMLFYVGEREGGCCADDGFFALLDREWEEVSDSPHHISWWGIHCGLTLYRRASAAPGEG